MVTVPSIARPVYLADVAARALARNSRKRGRGAAPPFLPRLSRALGLLVSREVAVLTNAIAFNFLLCLFPLLMVLVAAAQRLAPEGGAAAAVRTLLAELIPFGGETMAASLRQITKLARGLELLSLALVVWGSSGIFVPVEMVLNRVWGGREARTFWKSRILAFLLTTACGALALVSVALTLVARGYGREWPLVAGFVAKAAALLLTWAVFVMVYRLATDVPVGLGTACGAAWAAVLWELSKYAFVWNLGRTNLASLYGPLAFAVSLVLWAYVSSLVLVFGAAIAPVASRRS
jgi:YihY family inner membrane protein